MYEMQARPGVLSVESRSIMPTLCGGFLFKSNLEANGTFPHSKAEAKTMSRCKPFKWGMTLLQVFLTHIFFSKIKVYKFCIAEQPVKICTGSI